MAAEQQSQAASVWSTEAVEPIRRGRSADSARRQAAVGGPAFISDEAEELHCLDTMRDPAAGESARGSARLALARIYELRGQFAEAAEMYERNIWAGLRTPATFAGLAAAYRKLGRDDLADSALEQVRRPGGAMDTTAPPSDAARRGQTSTRARQHASQNSSIGGSTTATMRLTSSRSDRRLAARRGPEPTGPAAAASLGSAGASVLDQIQRTVTPFLEGQAGRRTLIASTVLLPIVVGLGVFAAVVLTSARPRSAELAAPTPAPVATVVATTGPTAVPTPAVPAALSQPPAPARLVVNNVGTDGLSLRRTPSPTGQRIKIWKDGTEMADLGETTEEGGKSWRKVRDPDGNVGWTAAEYLADPATRAAAQAAPAAPRFASGGLGLTRTEWEQVHGKPSQSSIFLEYHSGRLVVGLLESNIWHVERRWMSREEVALEQAREDARTYLPADATLTQSIDKGDGRIVDVYASTSLGSRFGSTAWNGGKVGTFSIQYRFRTPADRMVTSAMFRLGDAQF